MASGKRRLIEEGKAELVRLLEERIDEDGMTPDEIEAVVEKTMGEVASWVEERLIAEQQPPETNLAPCPQCQQLSPYKRIVATGMLRMHGLQTPVGSGVHWPVTGTQSGPTGGLGHACGAELLAGSGELRSRPPQGLGRSRR